MATFATGDYIATDQTVMLQVIAVINPDSKNPLYGLVNKPKPNAHEEHSYIKWATEFELQRTHVGEFRKIEPDFALWETLEEGDVIHCGGVGNDGQQVVVLARIGQAVMLSLMPDKPEKKEHVSTLKDQLAKLGESEDFGARVASNIATNLFEKDGSLQYISTTDAFKTANCHWHTIEQLALMNWRIIRE